MYTTISVPPYERAIVLRDARPWRWLDPGRHGLLHPMSTVEVVRFNIDLGYATLTPELRSLLPETVGELLEVPARHIAAVRMDGRPLVVLEPGHYVLWQARAAVTAELHSLEPVASTLGQDFWALAPARHVNVLLVQNGFKGLLMVDGVMERVLEPGRHPINGSNRVLTHLPVDLREQELQIVGQEVMTSDKVTVRVNIVLKYKVADAVASVSQVTVARDALYVEAQLVARRQIAAMSIDALLEARDQLGTTMAQSLAQRALGWGVEVVALDLKDIVLPGEMKTILNRVIEAEKQAAANLILRREETAATRSMANTAKVLEANPMLLRLKEMETLKDMADRIDNVTVVASGDLMGRMMLPLQQG